MIQPNKQLYANLLSRPDVDIPLFYQPWYLDAVCSSGTWDVALHYNGSRITAFLVYFIQKKYGQKVILNPLLTPYSGTFLLDEPSTKTETSVKALHAAVIDLLSQIPADITWQAQSLHPFMHIGLPFHWRGYDTSIKYTFVIPQLTSWNWDSLSPNVRNKIRKAQEILHFRQEQDASVPYRMLHTTLKSKNIKMVLTLTHFMAVDKVLESHNSRFVFVASDKSGHVHASAYIMYDQKTAYLMMIGSDPDLRESGAVPYLIYHTILFMKDHVSKFDFEGNMLESVFNMFAGFAAVPTQFLFVSKAKNNFWDLIKRLKSRL